MNMCQKSVENAPEIQHPPKCFSGYVNESMPWEFVLGHKSPNSLPEIFPLLLIQPKTVEKNYGEIQYTPIFLVKSQHGLIF